MNRVPLSLYVHLPWCIKKCPYCDFNSHGIGDDRFPEDDYVRSLIRDIDFEQENTAGRVVQSIFIGGGTPSLFSGAGMSELMKGIRERFELAVDVEVTLEANPGTVESQRFSAYRDCGINRLSLGIQSFDDRKLLALGRIHDGKAAETAIQTAKTAGFERINFDIMYGLPGQTIDDAMQDLEMALGHSPLHLSWYQLTIEPNTVFYKQRPALPAEDDSWAMQEAGRELLETAGLNNYEISAYARAAFQCRHNLNYWQFGDYLGIGAGAHSKLSSDDGSVVTRTARHRLPDRYMQLAGGEKAIVETRTLDENDLVLEFMMNAMRLRDGFSFDLFEQRTGIPRAGILTMLEPLVQKSWLEVNEVSIKPTESGRTYLNELLEAFMQDQELDPDQIVGGTA